MRKAKKLILFGAGDIGKKIIDCALEENIKIECVIDNDPEKWGTQYRGIKINPPDYLLDQGKDLEIIISIFSGSEIENSVILQLSKIGFNHGKNLFTWREFSEQKRDRFLGKRFVKVEPVVMNPTHGNKYFAVTEIGEKYFCVYSNDFTSKRQQFEMMQKVANLGVPIPRPMEYGNVFHEGGYLLLEWIDGDSFSKILPTLTEREQYTIGVKAGEYLRKIHSVQLPQDSRLHPLCHYQSMQNHMLQYPEQLACFTDVEHKLLDYINRHKHLLETTHVSYCHMDYHCVNMMIAESGELKIVDFNGSGPGVSVCDIGQLFFYRHAYNTAPCFFIGELHGYFDGKVPEEKWQTFNFYAAITAVIFSINVLHRHPDMREYVSVCNTNFLGAYSDIAQNPVPTWYRDISQMFV